MEVRQTIPEVEKDAIYDEAGDLREEDREFMRTVSTPFILMEAPLRFRAMAGNA